jgi:hypothetical protein
LSVLGLRRGLALRIGGWPANQVVNASMCARRISPTQVTSGYRFKNWVSSRNANRFRFSVEGRTVTAACSK